MGRVLITRPWYDETTSYLSKWSERIVEKAGHGNPEAVEGQNGEVLVEAGENHKILNSKIVYSRTCSSAVVLGKKSVESGTDAYVGYSAPFIFIYDESRTTEPRKDKKARPFFEATNLIPLSLLKGNTVRKAIEKSEKKFDEYIGHYASTKSPWGAEILPYLRLDKKVQTAIGDKRATL